MRWHFRGAILDRLDEYFACLRQVRRADRTAYDLLGQIGMVVPADMFCRPTPETWGALPDLGFGGVMVGSPPSLEADRETSIYPSFVYFLKQKRPFYVRGVPPAANVYQLTAVYDDRRRSGSGWVSNFATAGATCYVQRVGDAGIRILPQWVESCEAFRIQGRNRATRHNVTIRQRAVSLPSWVSAYAMNHPELKDKTPEQVIEDWFQTAAYTYRESLEKLVVRVERGGQVAAFGIDVKRCPYFFRDRGLEALAADGKRKRIFHSVIEHSRDLADGRSTMVRAHFRGIRRFSWNGATVRIVAPAHKGAIAKTGDLVCRVYDPEFAPMPESGTVGAKEVGAMISEHLGA